METVKIPTLSGRVLRAFYVSGTPVQVGAIVNLPRNLALEMAAAKRLELIEPKAEAKGESKAETKPAPRAKSPDAKPGDKTDAS